MKVKVKPFQSLFDIAVQQTGKVENAFEIAQANNMEITADLVAGTDLVIPDGLDSDKRVLKYYAEYGVIPATAQLGSDVQLIIEEGDLCYGGPFGEEFDDPYDRDECNDYVGTPIIVFEPTFSEEF